MANVSARQIEAPFYREMGFGFEVLRENFAKDKLFAEVLRTDHDAVRPRRPAARHQPRKNARKRKQNAAHHDWGVSRFSRSPRLKSASSANSAAGIAPARIT